MDCPVAKLRGLCGDRDQGVGSSGPSRTFPYAEHFASVNVIAQRIEANPGAVVSYSHEVISDSDLEKANITTTT
jgi:hypothetical protein